VHLKGVSAWLSVRYSRIRQTVLMLAAAVGARADATAFGPLRDQFTFEGLQRSQNKLVGGRRDVNGSDKPSSTKPTKPETINANPRSGVNRGSCTFWFRPHVAG
jgi:hypothetical protein